VAKPELGSKRQCQSCGAKFFDLNKDPILCPKCGTVFQVAAVTRGSSRAAPIDDDAETEVAGAELVPLEDADATDDKVAAVSDDDIEIEDDAGDETFLEEEEGDPDDVAGLIDSDLQDDEET
jgi:uncharacterized protein (TIGR02300 family)